MLDENNVVRVVRYVKRHETRNPVTKLAEARTSHLDWGIGAVDGDGGYYVYGSPFQIFAGCEGLATGDSHVLYLPEVMPVSNLPSAAAATIAGDQYLHFKYPNI